MRRVEFIKSDRQVGQGVVFADGAVALRLTLPEYDLSSRLVSYPDLRAAEVALSPHRVKYLDSN